MNLDTIILWLAKAEFYKVTPCPGTATYVIPEDAYGFYQFVDLTDPGDEWTTQTVEIGIYSTDDTDGLDISDFELVFWATDGIVTHYTFDSEGGNPFHWRDKLPESIDDFNRIIQEFLKETLNEVHRYASN